LPLSLAAVAEVVDWQEVEEAWIGVDEFGEKSQAAAAVATQRKSHIVVVNDADVKLSFAADDANDDAAAVDDGAAADGAAVGAGGGVMAIA